MASLQPVERPMSLAEVVARELEAWVRQGGLAAGAQLPSEKELVGRFCVSRAVIREAVSRLKADGWIESRQGAGAFVAPQGRRASFRLIAGGAPGAATLGDIFELRSVVEAGAAELAARRRRPEDLACLAEAMARMEAALDDTGGAEDGPNADDAFHVAIAAATGNPMIQQFVAFMGQQFSDSRRPTWDAAGQGAGRAAAAQAEHRAIFEAIQAGDGAAAAQAAREHIAAAAQRLGLAHRLGVDENEEGAKP